MTVHKELDTVTWTTFQFHRTSRVWTSSMPLLECCKQNRGCRQTIQQFCHKQRQWRPQGTWLLWVLSPHVQLKTIMYPVAAVAVIVQTYLEYMHSCENSKTAARPVPHFWPTLKIFLFSPQMVVDNRKRNLANLNWRLKMQSSVSRCDRKVFFSFSVITLGISKSKYSWQTLTVSIVLVLRK